MRSGEGRGGGVKMVHHFLRLGRTFQVRCLRRGLRLFTGSRLEVTKKPVLVIAPHPDDEALGCGGLIALKRAAGVPVRVVFLTDGSSAWRPEPAPSPEEFVKRREQEARASAAILGIRESDGHFFGLADGRLGDAAQRGAATSRLCELLKTCCPGEVFTPHRRDRHPDHEAAWKITCAAIRDAGVCVDLIQYPIWMMWSAPLFLSLTPGQLAGATCLCVEPVRARKRRAIAAYRSQLAPLPEGFLPQFLGSHELFFRTSPP